MNFLLIHTIQANHLMYSLSLIHLAVYDVRKSISWFYCINTHLRTGSICKRIKISIFTDFYWLFGLLNDFNKKHFHFSCAAQVLMFIFLKQNGKCIQMVFIVNGKHPAATYYVQYTHQFLWVCFSRRLWKNKKRRHRERITIIILTVWL